MVEVTHRSFSPKKRSEARLAAVKALYANDINRNVTANEDIKDPEELGMEIIECYRDDEEGRGEVALDEEFLLDLVKRVCENTEILDTKITKFLGDGWSLERLGPVMRAILRAGVCKLMAFQDIPFKVVINEYVNITRGYFSEKEVGFANGILDKIAHDVRENE